MPTHEVNEDDFDRIVDVNLKGVWLCMKYQIRQMLSQNEGAIVNNSSVAGLVSAPNVASYAASKHGVVGLTKTAALEYAQQGIRVNAICAAFTRTPLTEAGYQNIERRNIMVSKQPIGRLATPEEIAESVIWLCSDAASFVTGHAMAIDGGWTAQ